MTGTDLLVRVDFVKFRSSGASRSPIGTFFVYEDRVEWIEKEGTEKLVISFSDIKGKFSTLMFFFCLSNLRNF